MTTLALSGTVPQADAHIVFTRPKSKGKGVQLQGAHKLKQSARVLTALEALSASGSLNELLVIPAGGASAATTVIAVGLGNSHDRDDLRHAVGNAVRGLSGKRKAVIAPPSNDEATVRAVVEGALMAAYAFDEFRTEKSKLRPGVKQLVLAVDGVAALKSAVDRAEATARAVNRTRDLANTPPGHLPPAELVARALADVKGLPVKTQVLDEKQLRAGGYGGIVGVGQGAQRPPRLLRLEYRPKGAKKHIAVVGKGITFDSGGISIKGASAMDEMKFDMCGAAAVFGALRAAAELKLRLNVVGVVPACENLPSGTANKPGDIVTSMSGQTIEVLNTDAEGRLILCDALTYAERFRPAAVVDIATLTGACVVALGDVNSGLFTADDALADELLAAAKAAVDPAWRMPVQEEYQESLKSNFADMANIGAPGKAGAVTAACFLARFAKAYPWAHIDIAGTAWKSGPAKSATGRPVPLLAEFLMQRAG